ncbi:MAG: hypothetical protein EBR30_24480 [Cytophagia bacterium]|nr:hypothetical protein [Cytophagia bacterium]
MKMIITLVAFAFPLVVASACDSEKLLGSNDVLEDRDDHEVMNDTITISVGNKTFAAILFDNGSAKAFKAMLPLTLNMTELNANEKYFNFANNLPVSASNPGTIHSGDLMLWGANTLVLFYKTFSTSYSYTKLGRISDPQGLASALGSDSVMVKFEHKE